MFFAWIFVIADVHLTSGFFFFSSFSIVRMIRAFRVRTTHLKVNDDSGLRLLSSKLLIPKPDIGLGVRVFANGPGDLGSIPGRVIPKTQKMVLDASLLNTQHYEVLIKGKVEQSREGVAPSPTPWCSSYRKGSLRVTLDYGRQLYFFLYVHNLALTFFLLSHL